MANNWIFMRKWASLPLMEIDETAICSILILMGIWSVITSELGKRLRVACTRIWRKIQLTIWVLLISYISYRWLTKLYNHFLLRHPPILSVINKVFTVLPWIFALCLGIISFIYFLRIFWSHLRSSEPKQ